MDIPIPLLDVAAGADIAYSSPLFQFLLVLAGIILVEALVMLLLGYSSFGKALLDSLLVNIASTAAGYLAAAYLDVERIAGYNSSKELLYYLAATLLIEVVLLWLLNHRKPFGKTLVTGLVINIVSYALMYFIFFR